MSIGQGPTGFAKQSTEDKKPSGSVEKLPNRVDATPSSRFCWNKKAAGAPLLLCSAELFNNASSTQRSVTKTNYPSGGLIDKNADRRMPPCPIDFAPINDSNR
jgi:hypothetical protein